MQNRKDFLIINKKKIFYKPNKNVFEPNLTSKLLIEAAVENIKIKKSIKLLDLGCGCGAVGLSIAKILKIKDGLFFSDLSMDALKNTKQNLDQFNKKGVVKSGSMFKPWQGEKFDIIINDISAISSMVSKISPWFKKIPCESGKDGTDLTLEFLKKLNNYTKKGTIVFFPVLSLSNEKKIIKFAKKKYANLKCVKKIRWPLPKNMNNKKNKLEKLKNLSYINFEIISGKIVCNTSVYMLTTI